MTDQPTTEDDELRIFTRELFADPETKHGFFAPLNNDTNQESK